VKLPNLNLEVLQEGDAKVPVADDLQKRKKRRRRRRRKKKRE